MLHVLITMLLLYIVAAVAALLFMCAVIAAADNVNADAACTVKVCFYVVINAV